MGALYFFITSILCFVLFKLSRKGNDFRLIRTNKNIFYLLLGIAFLFAAGEEISWGQRIFNIPVPKAWETINAQKELTIHNLNFLQGGNVHPFLNVIDLTSMNTLFLLFSLGLCFFIPLLNKFNQKFSKWQKQIGLPLVPIKIGIIFAVSFLFSTIIRFYFSYMHLVLRADSEIRESIWAFLFLIIAVFWIKKEKTY